MKRSLLASWSAAAYLAALAVPSLTVSVADAQTPYFPPGSGGGGSGTVTSITCPNATVTVSGNCFPIAAGGTSGDIIVASGTSGNATDSGIALTSGITDGQLLIGNTTSGKMQVGTLVAGSNITITPGHGNVTIASSGGGNVTGCEAPGSVLDAILLDSASNGNCTAMASVGTLGQTLTSQGSAASPLFKSNAIVVANVTAAANPGAPGNTSAYFMQGVNNLLGNVTLTPTRSGNVEFVIQGQFASISTTAGDGANARVYYGTGTPPANGASLTGTQCTVTVGYKNPTTVIAADVLVPFTFVCVATGLTVGTAYWWDIAAESLIDASQVKFTNVSESAHEF